MLRLLDEASGDLVQLREGVERWFDETMERVSGWYQRKLRYITLAVGLVLAIILNADTVLIAQTLWTSPAERALVVATAAEVQRSSGQPSGGTFSDQTQAIEQAVDQLRSSHLPIFWSLQAGDQRGLPADMLAWLSKILGLLLTTAAVSLGAPFWFDVLNKFIQFRSSGDPPKAQTSSVSST